MDKKLTFTVIIGILILGIGLFYWYEWRPSQIRQKCYTEVALNPYIVAVTSKETDTIKREDLQNKLIDKEYLNCLRERGLSN